ncbi:MAG: phBC6A51 family helix-turn-helix protein [Clostridia bacterium]|jgi:hypothetical protein
MGRGRKIVARKDLYGQYPDLSETEKEYVKIKSDPENTTRNLTEEYIANLIGVNKKTLYNMRQKATVRDAIVSETKRKAADNFADVTGQLLKIIQDKSTKDSDKITAIKLYGQLYGLIDEARDKTVEKKIGEKSSLEDKLRRMKMQYEQNNSERRGTA